MKTLIIMMSILFLYSCERPVPKIVDAGEFVSSYNGIVTTTSGQFILSGDLSAFHGEKVTIRVYKNTYNYLCVNTVPMCRPIH